jgi:signal transduction histidine kinase
MEHSVDGSQVLLVVDDTAANRLAMRAVLEPLGQTVVEVESGEEALKYLLDHDCAVILLDVRMPGMSGLEVAEALKSRERTRPIPILFVTAHTPEELGVQYPEGAFDFIVKPFDPQTLVGKVGTLLALHREREARRREVESLNAEVGTARDNEIEAMQARQQQSDRVVAFQGQLMAIVGHDLRTPLTAVLLSAHSLLSSGKLSAEHLDCASDINRAGLRMKRLLADLVDFTRVRLGNGLSIRPDRCSDEDLCAGVVGEFERAHPDRVIRMVVDPGCAGEGFWDRERLEQVLANLLSNGLQYSVAPSEVVLALRKDPAGACIEVRSIGPIIPPERLKSLFDPFKRGDKAPDNGSNLGLGLFIVDQIVRAHGGTVEASSRQEDGTRFVVRLPRGPPPAAHPREAPAAA